MLTDEKMLRWKQTPKGGYLQGSQFLLHFVQKPTHKGGDLGQWKSIRRAVTSKSKGLEPKSKFRAFPLTKRLGNLGKNTPSITKLFQCTPSLQNRVQKQEDFQKGRITVPLVLHNSMCFNTLINRHTGGQSNYYRAPNLGRMHLLLHNHSEKSCVKS